MSESSRPSDAFPARLKEARELRGVSQAELAARAGLQASAVSHFETGGRKPSFDNLRRLAQALEVTTDYLLGRANEPGGTTTTDRLYRNIQDLRTSDREFIEQWIKSKVAHDKRGQR